MDQNASSDWPSGESEMARRVRTRDWSATPLGPIGNWPASLRFAVDILLSSGFPMVALWGPDLVQVYNDDYRDLMGVKHPAGLGQSTRECWPEVWHINAPIYERVLAGETVRIEEGLYPITRNGVLADAWFTLAYSPLRNEPGGIAGVLVIVVEASERVRALRESEARQAFLLKFSDALRTEPSEDAIINRALRMLAEELALDRCYATILYPEEDRTEIIEEFWRPGLMPMPSTFQNSDFPKAKAQTIRKTLIIDDTANDPELTDTDKRSLAAMGFGAFLSSPLRHATGYPFWSLGAVNSAPRRWTTGEVALIEEATERTWAMVERARAEAALRQSQGRLTAAFESVPVGISAIDAEGRVIIANHEYRRFVPTGVIPSRDPEHVTRWQGWDKQGKKLNSNDFPGARALRGESVIPGQELLYTDNDGQEFWINTATVPTYDQAGRVTGCVSVASDVTERKRDVEALRESEQALASDLAHAERLRSLSERLVPEESIQAIYDEILSATVAIMQADAGTIQIYDPGTKSLELIASQNFSRTITDYFHRVDADSRTACGIALKTGERAFVDFPDEVADLGCQLLTGEGIQSAVAFPLVSRTGTPLGMLNAHWRQTRYRPNERDLRFLDLLARQAADLIEQRRNQSALRESEERQTFLLKLSDALRAEPSEAAIIDLVLRMLAEELELDRCYATALYPEEDRTDVLGECRRPGLTPIPSTLRNSDFPEAEAQAFRGTMIFNDTANDPRLTDTDKHSLAAMSFAAFLSSPLRHATGYPFWSLGAVSSKTRHWTSGEIMLMEQATERTWAAVERARAETALRGSEELRRIAIEGGGMGTWRWNLRDSLIWGDAAFLELWGYPPTNQARQLADFAERMSPQGQAEMEEMVSRAVAAGEEFDGQLAVVGGPTNGRWVRWRGRSERQQPWIVNGVSFDVTEQHAMETRLRESEELRRIALEGGAMGAWRWNIRSRSVQADEVVQRLWGFLPSDQPQPVSNYVELMQPDGAAWLEAVMAREIAPGEVIDQQIQIAGGLKTGRWVQLRSRAERETPWIVNGVSFDVTDQKQRETEERLKLLIAELQHRTRNLLSVVSGIADQTLATSETLDQFASRFDQRLAALGRVQGLLSIGPLPSITLAGLLALELDAHGIDPTVDPLVSVSGPDVALSSEIVQLLALAIHELTTNALKHGALRAQGQLRIDWTVSAVADGSRWLMLKWLERGVKIEGEIPHGFGRQLIEIDLPYELDARTRLEFSTDSVSCGIEILLPPLDT